MTIETESRLETKGDVLLSVSDAAMKMVLEIRDKEDEPENTGLRVEVAGVNGIEYRYDLSFDDISGADDTDHTYTIGDLTVMVPQTSVEMMRGSTLDLPSNSMQEGLVIRNPNRPNPMGDMDDIELEGDAAAKVEQLLELKINPALASHGGFANLVKVEGETAHVLMGGGCQGCSMSAITLSEGIKNTILEMVPEITEVIDATNHDAGENPFYS
ncbi:MAG: NifU family protein [Acidimicrobiales bacterium]